MLDTKAVTHARSVDISVVISATSTEAYDRTRNKALELFGSPIFLEALEQRFSTTFDKHYDFQSGDTGSLSVSVEGQWHENPAME